MITAVQNQEVYILYFNYNPDIITLVKNVPGRKYVPEKKYWTIPLDRLGFLIAQLQGTPYEQQFRVISAEHINENTTMDASGTIPDIDLSEIPLYIKDGEHFFQHQLDFMKYAIDRQRRGIYSGFLLADQPGLGKTLEAMNLALYNKRFNGIKHCLIITCVNSAKYNWVADIKKHTNGKYTPYLLGSRKKKRKEGIRLEGSSEEKLEDLLHGYMYNDDTCNPLPFFLIMNIEAIRYKKDRKYQIRDRLIKLINSGYIGMVILDECHKGISPSSSQGYCILEIKRKTANTKIEWLPMTGTPIVNKPTDLFTPLKLVDGHSYTNYRSWRENFCIYGGFGDRVLLGYKNMPQLKQMLQSSMLRRLKSEVLDLPPKIHIIEYVEDTPYQAQLYKTLVDETAKKRDKILAAVNPRAEFIRLRQISGSPELVDKSIVVNKAYLAKNAKLTRLMDLVDTIVENDEKVIIFSNWVEPLRTVYKFLASKNEVCCYTGTMKAEVREEHKQRFRTDPNCRILIGTVGALGPSHNLPEASNVIFYDLPWNPATLEQAEDRAYRPETKQALNVYCLISRGTVDEVVYNIIMTKDGLSKYLVDNELDIKNNSKLFDLLIGAAVQNSEGSNENIL